MLYDPQHKHVCFHWNEASTHGQTWVNHADLSINSRGKSISMDETSCDLIEKIHCHFMSYITLLNYSVNIQEKNKACEININGMCGSLLQWKLHWELNYKTYQNSKYNLTLLSCIYVSKMREMIGVNGLNSVTEILLIHSSI